MLVKLVLHVLLYFTLIQFTIVYFVSLHLNSVDLILCGSQREVLLQFILRLFRASLACFIRFTLFYFDLFYISLLCVTSFEFC